VEVLEVLPPGRLDTDTLNGEAVFGR
jgi:hypothetical protein